MQSSNINWTVGQAIQDFYNHHDFGYEGGVHEKIAWIKFGPLSIPIFNPKSRRTNVYLHDVSHLVTGYDTSWKGESSVSAWEIASGGWNNLYIPWLFTLAAMGLGVLVFPKNVLSAFKRGLTMRNALTCGLSKDEVFKLSVTELQQLLRDKPKSNKNPFVWMGISLLVFIFPFVAAISIAWVVATLF